MEEVENCSSYIQKYFFLRSLQSKPYATLRNITEYVQSVYQTHNPKSFSVRHVYYALNRFIFDNIDDIRTNSNWLIDFEMKKGYLIQRSTPHDVWYIFQRADEINQRQNLFNRTSTKISLSFKNLSTKDFVKIKKKDIYNKYLSDSIQYDFDSISNYYARKLENKEVVGFILKNTELVGDIYGNLHIGEGVGQNVNFGRN